MSRPIQLFTLATLATSAFAAPYPSHNGAHHNLQVQVPNYSLTHTRFTESDKTALRIAIDRALTQAENEARIQRLLEAFKHLHPKPVLAAEKKPSVPPQAAPVEAVKEEKKTDEKKKEDVPKPAEEKKDDKKEEVKGEEKKEDEKKATAYNDANGLFKGLWNGFKGIFGF